MVRAIGIADTILRWVLPLAILGGLITISIEVGLLHQRIMVIEQDLNLGDPLTTSSFRRLVLDRLRELQNQVQLNGDAIHLLQHQIPDTACHCDDAEP